MLLRLGCRPRCGPSQLVEAVPEPSVVLERCSVACAHHHLGACRRAARRDGSDKITFLPVGAASKHLALLLGLIHERRRETVRKGSRVAPGASFMAPRATKQSFFDPFHRLLRLHFGTDSGLFGQFWNM